MRGSNGLNHPPKHGFEGVRARTTATAGGGYYVVLPPFRLIFFPMAWGSLARVIPPPPPAVPCGHRGVRPVFNILDVNTEKGWLAKPCTSKKNRRGTCFCQVRYGVTRASGSRSGSENWGGMILQYRSPGPRATRPPAAAAAATAAAAAAAVVEKQMCTARIKTYLVTPVVPSREELNRSKNDAIHDRGVHIHIFFFVL